MFWQAINFNNIRVPIEKRIKVKTKIIIKERKGSGKIHVKN